MRSARNRIAKVFKGAKVDAILLSNTKSQDPNFLYLTGFTGGVFEGDILIVMRGGEVLLTSPLEYEIAMAQRPGDMEVVQIGKGGRKDAVRRIRALLKGKRVGVNASFLPYSYYAHYKKLTKAREFVDVTENLSNARAVKGRDEISNIRVAVKIIKKAINGTLASLKAGMTEKQAAARIEYLIRENGGDGSSFTPIVCFGKNAALPHHLPDDTKLEKNSFVLLDCGAKYNNYCSDITRTVVFMPDKSSAKYKQMKEMLQTVETAQGLAMKHIKAGVGGNVSYDAALKYIDTVHGGKYKGTFMHSLGHPVGLEVHDVGPGLGGGRARLRENMVVSNEPGIYIPGFGGVRLEDDVVVTRKGGKIL